MIKGLYAAASAMLAGLARQSVIGHNIANVDTPGFKQTLATLGEYGESQILAGPNYLSQLGSLGLGVEIFEEVVDFSEGSLRQTGYPFDLAIQGNGFFRVETPNGERYTRDGRFTLDLDNQLVTVDGYFVLDTNGNRIVLPQKTDRIDAKGSIIVNGTAVTQIALVAFADPKEELVMDLPGVFTGPAQGTSTELGEMQQGYLEMANVDLSQLMTQMVSVNRAYDAAQRLVQVNDQLLGRSISTLGRF